MRKKKCFLVSAAVLAAALSGCSGADAAGPVRPLEKEGIAPYELTEEEEYLLKSFGISRGSKILSFRAPQEAITLNLAVHELTEDGLWETTQDWDISIGPEREPVEELAGIFTMWIQDDYSIDFHISCGGLAAFTCEAPVTDQEVQAGSWSFLYEFQEIALEEEIPVAIITYEDGTEVSPYAPGDYFKPEKLSGAYVAQAVTLTFSEREI